MKFVIFHGAFGSPDDNWFPQLREKLQSPNHHILVPQFPVDDWDKVTNSGPGIQTQNQTLAHWLNTFEDKIMPFVKNADKICFIGHSVGSLFILHAVNKFDITLDSAIFVCPFMQKLNKDWQIDWANKSFYKSNFDFKKLRNLIPHSFVIYSDNDPYVTEKFSIDFASLGSSKIEVKGAGHFNDLKYASLIYKLCKKRIDD